MDKKVKVRSLLIGICFTICFIGLVSRLYWVQVVNAEKLTKEAEVNWKESEILPAVRGSILDRNNKALAEDIAAFTVTVNPSMIAARKLEKEVSHGLAVVLNPTTNITEIAMLEKKIYTYVTKKRPNSEKLAVEVEIGNEGRKIDGETKQKIDEFIERVKQTIPEIKKSDSIGINMKQSVKRYYPLNSLASHILGYTDKEGKSIGGIESLKDTDLKGTPGKLSHETDKAGVEILDSKVSLTPAMNGKSVKLTIDKNIQYYMESALQKATEKYKPKSMSAIAVDPKTMEILAMANTPDFNPNRYWEINSQNDFKNHAIESQYEPGSTFKLVTLAGAIEEKLFNPAEIYQSGTISIPGDIIHDHNGVGWGKITFLEGWLRSSNVAFVKLGYDKLGVTKLKSYIEKFGFGSKTGIDLPNESAGIVGQMKYPSEVASSTYGQGQVVVTALQQVAAYAAIANGGKLMQPYVVKEIIDPETQKVVKSNTPKEIRRVVSEETARQTSLYLEQVVANQEIGTGRSAYINGYRVAGKTGTANIIEEGKSKYSEKKWLISFVGYAPVEDPKILVMVIADLPEIGGDYHRGSEVSIPVFKEIVSQSLRYMGVSANAIVGKTVVNEAARTIPDLSGTTISVAKNLLSQVGLKAELLGNGGKVVKQFPIPGTVITMTQKVYILTESATSLNIVPNFTGKSLRESIEICSLLNMLCKATGEGYVTAQTLEGQGEQRFVTLKLLPLDEPINKPEPTPKVAVNKTRN